MNFITDVFKIIGLVIFVLFVGTFAVRPHWFGLVTPDTVTQAEYEQSSKSNMIPEYSPISPIKDAPKAQGQYFEESAPAMSAEFITTLGDSNVTFTDTSLNQRECNYLLSKGVEPIDYSEFIATANSFLTAEQDYFFDSLSVTPLEFYVEMLHPFCPDLTEQVAYELYDDYVTEVVRPAIVYWNNHPEEMRADVRNTHTPRTLDYTNN